MACWLPALILPLLLGPGAGQPAEPQALTGDAALAAAWIAKVEQHVPGTFDAAAQEIADRWPAHDLRSVLKGLPKAFKASDRDEAACNRVLLKGALLHASIAILAPLRAAQLRSLEQGASPGAILARDGRGLAPTHVTAHWEVGRVLLDRVTPDPAQDERVQLWYHATGAHMLWRYQMAGAIPHVAHAKRLLPEDPVILLYSGALHETLGSPRFVRLVELLRTRGGRFTKGFPPEAMDAAERQLWRDTFGDPVRSRSTGWQSVYGSPSQELEWAERDFRQALRVDPAATEARLRLGRVLAQRGRHEEAARELATARDEALEPALRYYACLLLGGEEAILGRRDAARESFERAATLFPTAQSPLLALSELARRAGDRRSAQEALQKLAALPAGAEAREDPWWEYHAAHGRHHKALLAQLVTVLNQP